MAKVQLGRSVGIFCLWSPLEMGVGAFLGIDPAAAGCCYLFFLGSMQMRSVVIGLDLGHSAVKLTFDGKKGVERAIFKSLACSAFKINNEQEQERTSRETVTVDGQDFFVGDSAEVHGKAVLSSGLTDDWIQSREHAALMMMARKIVNEQALNGDRFWVLGLPVKQFEAHKNELKIIAQTYLGEEDDFRIIPQPLGGYKAHMFSRAGVPAHGRDISSESWGVIDVGYYSTDFILIHEGRWIEKASGGCGGVKVAVESLQKQILDTHNISLDLVDTETALRRKVVKNYGPLIDVKNEIEKASEVLATQVADMARRLMDAYARNLDGVLVTGGGADMVVNSLRERWPHVRPVEDPHDDLMHKGPRYIISEGYYRFGRFTTLMQLQGLTGKAA